LAFTVTFFVILPVPVTPSTPLFATPHKKISQKQASHLADHILDDEKIVPVSILLKTNAQV